jgi:hypothetical protein
MVAEVLIEILIGDRGRGRLFKAYRRLIDPRKIEPIPLGILQNPQKKGGIRPDIRRVSAHPILRDVDLFASDRSHVPDPPYSHWAGPFAVERLANFGVRHAP